MTKCSWSSGTVKTNGRAIYDVETVRPVVLTSAWTGGASRGWTHDDDRLVDGRWPPSPIGRGAQPAGDPRDGDAPRIDARPRPAVDRRPRRRGRHEQERPVCPLRVEGGAPAR